MQVSIVMVRALVGVIERAGGDRERFFTLAGIDPQLIDDSSARVPIVDYERALRAALAVSNDEAFGLHMGEFTNSVMFDVLGRLAEHAKTLRGVVETIVRYSRIVAEGHEAQLSEEGEIASIRFPSFRGRSAPVRLTAEFVMSALLRALRQFVRHDAQPTNVFFAYAAPTYAAEYTRIFGGTESFGHACTEIQFPRAWLDHAQLYQSPELYALLKTQADQTLARLERDAPLTERIKLILESHSPRPVTMEDVAAELEMSDRSLRRRLLAEGVTYGDLVEDSRINAAKRMLERRGASIQEAAYAMGFSTAAAFHRAFKRWTGMTPKQYRASF